jgi:tetratricopeptide (TPR) repeat protein
MVAFPNRRYADPVAETPHHRPPPSTPIARFLVLDVHEVLRGLLRPALESVGPVTMHFASTQAAWERAIEDASSYDFLVLDWDACEGPGLAVVHALRQRVSLRDASLVLLAGNITPEMESLRPLYRIAAFVPKPFTVADIARAVRAELTRRQQPDRLDLLLSRAWRLMDDGAAPKALLVYQWLRTLQPDSLPALYGAGAALGVVGEWEVGLRLLEEVVDRSPLFLEAWNRMSDLAEAEGDIRASEFAAQAAALAPTAPEVLVRRARAAQKAGNIAEAEKLLRLAFKAAPDLWAPAFELTELLLGQDRVYDAARVVDRVRTQHRARVDLLNHLGVALRRRGYVAVARQTYALALAEEPGNTALLYNAAVAHLAAGEIQRAKEDLREAVRIEPTFSLAKTLLERLSTGSAPEAAELDRL